MRSRMIDRASYVPPFAIGEVMQVGSAGEVVVSERANHKVGDHVGSMAGWRGGYTETPESVRNFRRIIMRILLLLSILLLFEFLYREIDINYQSVFAKDANDIVREQIKKGNAVNALDKDGDTPLHKFATFCNPNFVRALIDAGADVDKLNKYGVPPIYNAIRKNCFQVTVILIDEKANVRWKDKDSGNNLLHYASVLATEQEIRMLIQAGTDVNGLNNRGNSPIRTLLNWKNVSQHFRNERVKFLQQFGAKDIYLRLPDTDQNTKSAPIESKKTVPHKKKRDRKTRKNQQEP